MLNLKPFVLELNNFIPEQPCLEGSRSVDNHVVAVLDEDKEALSLNVHLLHRQITGPGTLHATHTTVRLRQSDLSDLPSCELLINLDQDRQPTRGHHDDVRGHQPTQGPLVVRGRLPTRGPRTTPGVLRELIIALEGLIVTQGAHHALCVTPEVHDADLVLEAQCRMVHLLLHLRQESI